MRLLQISPSYPVYARMAGDRRPQPLREDRDVPVSPAEQEAQTHWPALTPQLQVLLVLMHEAADNAAEMRWSPCHIQECCSNLNRWRT